MATRWNCGVCLTACKADEAYCPSCENPRRPRSNAESIPSVVFGAPQPLQQTPSFGAAVNETKAFAGLAAISTGPPAHSLPTAAPIVFGTSRLSFGPAGNIQPVAADIDGGGSAAATPNTAALSYCQAMCTPPRSATEPALIGCKPSDIPDKNESSRPSVLAAGCLLTWGSGECDQLAVRSDNLNENNCRGTPIVIKRFSDDIVEDVCCGSMCSFALLKTGEVYSWGCSDFGSLGRPLRHVSNIEDWEQRVQRKPQESLITTGKVPAPVWNLPENDKVVRISAGDSHACAITEAGVAYAWGHYRDYSGPLGFWSADQEAVVETQWIPQRLALEGLVLDIASGENHTIALVEFIDSGERAVYFWGSSEFGQCCQPPQELDDRCKYLKPRMFRLSELTFNIPQGQDKSGNPILSEASCANGIKQSGRILHVFAGRCTSFLMIESDSKTYIFGLGRNSYGELGAGFASSVVDKPVMLKVPGLCTFHDIQGGDQSTVALSTDGSIWSWGRSEFAGLGEITARTCSNITEPRSVLGLRNKAHMIGTGSKTVYVGVHGGQVFVWGEGSAFQLGDGTAPTDPVYTPTLLPLSSFNDMYVKKIRAGAQHAVALALRLVPRRGKRARSHVDFDETESTSSKKLKAAPFGTAVPMPMPAIQKEISGFDADIDSSTPRLVTTPPEEGEDRMEETVSDDTPAIKLPVPSQSELEPMEDRDEDASVVDDETAHPTDDLPVDVTAERHLEDEEDASSKVEAEMEEVTQIAKAKVVTRPQAKAKGKARAKAKSKAAAKTRTTDPVEEVPSLKAKGKARAKSRTKAPVEKAETQTTRGRKGAAAEDTLVESPALKSGSRGRKVPNDAKNSTTKISAKDKAQQIEKNVTALKGVARTRKQQQQQQEKEKEEAKETAAASLPPKTTSRSRKQQQQPEEAPPMKTSTRATKKDQQGEADATEAKPARGRGRSKAKA